MVSRLSLSRGNTYDNLYDFLSDARCQQVKCSNRAVSHAGGVRKTQSFFQCFSFCEILDRCLDSRLLNRGCQSEYLSSTPCDREIKTKKD